MAEGVVLKMSVDAAVKGQQDLQAATARTLDVMGKQSRVADEVERAMLELARAEETAAKAASTAATAHKRANDELTKSFGIYGGGTVGGVTGGGPRNLNAIGDGLIVVGKKAEAAANGVARSTAGAIPLVGKLTTALGGSAGVTRALGVFGDSARLLAGALNPLGIAVGLAAGAVFNFVANLVTSETPLQKTARLVKEAQENFDLLGDSAARARDAIAQAANARGSIPTTGSTQGRLDAASESLKRLKEAQAAQDEAVGQGANLRNAPLDLPAIVNLAKALDKGGEVIKALGRLATATGQEYDKALAVVRKAGLDVTGDRQIENPLLFQNLLRSGQSTEPSLSRSGTVALDPATAEALLNQALGEGTNLVRQLQRKLFEEAQKKADQAPIPGGSGGLALPGGVAAQGFVPSNFASVSAGLNQQAAFLRASPDEQRQILLRQRIASEQRNAGITDPFSGAGRSIARSVEELSQVEEATRRFDRIKEAGREAFDTIAFSIAQAVQEGKNFRQVLGAVAGNLSNLLLSRAIGAASNAIFGPPSGQAQLGAVLPRQGTPQQFLMGGGVVDQFTTLFAGGRATHIAEGGGSKPEGVLPLERDRYGRLGVIASDGGGGGNITLILPNVRNGEQARQVKPTLTQSIESIQRRSRRSLRAGR